MSIPFPQPQYAQPIARPPSDAPTLIQFPITYVMRPVFVASLSTSVIEPAIFFLRAPSLILADIALARIHTPAVTVIITTVIVTIALVPARERQAQHHPQVSYHHLVQRQSYRAIIIARVRILTLATITTTTTTTTATGPGPLKSIVIRAPTLTAGIEVTA
ncbi:hypothetical protein H4582DRAFT_2076133 [Lactarius indigo]|nr:hypothetical protein H4582DRAFT_2076133 [Lactarius indigo]